LSTSDPVSSSPRIGSTLRGKWTLERLLGEGGMASVYVARHKIGRLDAIKILHPAFAATPQLRARFEQEAHVVNRFRHHGAVEVRDIDTTEDGAPFIVMELLEGETLSAISRRAGGPLEVPMVMQMADEVLDVLAAAHAQGIIHRDIKPDNLLRLADGHIKVLDFGIARVREGMGKDFRTQTGTTLGTVAYMPPEQAKGTEIDGRADLYAVGATMFRLLTGRRVHEADTEAERFVKVVSEPAPPLASVAKGVPAHVCTVVDRALSFDRERRYPDATTMQADVRAAARGEAPVQAVTAAGAPASAAKEAATRAEVPMRAPAPAAAPAPAPAAAPAPVSASAPAPASAHAPASAARAPAPQEAATRFAPGVAQQIPTVVAGQVTQTPAMVPTAATRAIAPPRPTAPMPATVAAQRSAPSANRRVVIVLAIAAAACVAVVVVVLFALSGTGSDVTPGASSAPTASAAAGVTGTSATAPNEAPTAGPTHATPPAPPGPVPVPVPPGKHGHGR
jgi:serine/threonine-protein kinase